MKPDLLPLLLALGVMAIPLHAETPGPRAGWPAAPIAHPQDRPFPGSIRLSVDATDLDRRIVRIHESVSAVSTETVLLYPRWLPGTHAPEGPVDRVAGIRVNVNGRPVNWTRDPVDVHALRIHAAPGSTLDIDFDYLSATSAQVGPIEVTRDMLLIDWNELVLYPAGYFSRQILVTPDLVLPTGWAFATALDVESKNSPDARFKPVNLETLVDSPVYAGRYFSRLELDSIGSAPVHLNLFADRPEFLAVTPPQLEAHRALVREAGKLFGSHHFAHYDFLYSLSDQMQQMGLEHHQSSEDGVDPPVFTEWDANAYNRDLLAHEFVHSWNGKFRRPADLWTSNYNEPMQNSLLWVYEGQTQYWGQVLAARAGLRTRQQAMDQFALTAADYENQAGRTWRPLADTTNDEIINPRRPQSWHDWQRFEDYYEEGALIWLDVDTMIRERSQGKRSLDDFARHFFGIDDGSIVPVTYTFADVVKALAAVEPYDWSGYLRARLDSIGTAAPLEGLKRGGYALEYTDAPSDYQKAADAARKRVDLSYSIGIVIEDKDVKGSVIRVRWNSPAFQAKLTEGAQILAVNGMAYSPEALLDAIRTAQSAAGDIELITKTADRYRVVQVEYRGGLRYPHLKRDAGVPALLDEILTPRS